MKANSSPMKTDYRTPPEKARLIVAIDCTKEYPPEQYFGHGEVTVKETSVGKYREAEAKPLSRFGYRFQIENMGKPHVARIRYPDDKRRYMCIMDGTCYDLTTGVFTGWAQPLSGAMLELWQVFWPRWKDCSIVFTTWGEGEPAAASDIEIYELADLPPLSVPGDCGDGTRRELGIQYEDPCGIGAAEGAMNHKEWIDRVVQYARHSGQNLLVYPMAWYAGPQFPSQREPSDGLYGVVARDRKQYAVWTTHPADWYATLLERFGKEGLQFQGSLTLMRLGNLLKNMNIDLEAIKGGADTYNNMLWNNHVQSSTNDWTPFYNARNFTAIAEEHKDKKPFQPWEALKRNVYGEVGNPGGWGPMFNPLHPTVQEAILGFVEEIGRRYGKYPAFQGISFNMFASAMPWFGSIRFGYDDYSVVLFEKETGTAVPVDAKAPDRFSQRYEFLTKNHRADWVVWRCRKIRELFGRIRQALAAARPDLRVTVTLWDISVVPGVLGWASASLQLYARDSMLQFYREAGIDVDLYRDEPGLEVDRGMGNPCDRGGHPPSPTGGVNAPLEATTMYRDFHYLDQEFLDAFRQHDRPGAFIFNCWVEAWGRYVWFAPEDGDPNVAALAVMDGKPVEGIFRQNSEYPKDGFWWDSQSRITPGFQAGAHFLEPYAFALAEFDACRITRGGLFLDKAHGEELRQFARAYRALPRRKFAAVGASTDPVALRTLLHDGRRYFYAVNRDYYPVKVDVVFSARPTNAEDLATGEKLVLPQRWPLVLGPYELRSFAVAPETEITGFTATPPKDVVRQLRTDAEQALAAFEKVRAAGEAVPGMDKLEKRIRTALANGELAWLRRALSSYIVRIGVAFATESPGLPPAAREKTQLDKLVGQPVDITPWAYAWRADLAVQEKPEAYFIPRRLERMDKVYRTAFYALPEQELKSKYYQMPDLLKPLLPQPKGRLLAGLLWTGRIGNYQVELHWPASIQEIPSPEAVEVRVYPTSFGWFGWTVDKILSNPEVSGDRRTWTYKSDPAAKMDWAFSARVDAATEMVAVFYEDGKTHGGIKSAVPGIRVICPGMGVWKRMDLEIEWGFHASTEKADFDGRVQPYVAMVGPVSPLADDKGTTVNSAHTWQSRSAGGARRGIVVPLLYASGGCPALDSRVTIWTKTAGFSFRPGDLENGPILIPEHGIFVTKVGSGKTARQFAGALAERNLKGICQMTREHREAASWEEVMQEVRLSTCPAGTALPPFPKVPDPPMQVQLPDARWTDAWRAASFQLKGKHMWGGLAFEVGRVAHEMDLIGLHDEADKVYQHFFNAPGAKSDGDYTDGKGALEWATGMRHDMGYDHDGTHASTGRLLFGMAERYFLTGDKEWFQRNRVRMQEAADWIIRQRNLYMKDIPNRQDLFVAGLMPPCMLGDYALPSCDWHWYYVDNAFALQGLRRFADALTEFDPEAGRKYRDEADAFRRDIRRAVGREVALSPVRLVRNGTYRSFIPLAAYAGGVMSNLESGSPQRPQEDILMGALPLAEPFGALDANDFRIDGTLNVMEEIGMSPKVTTYILAVNVMKEIGTSVSAMGELDNAWFWTCYGGSFPKASHNANIYLLQDDVPNFLRFWMNCYAALVGADGKLWEWGQLGKYTNCSSPDNGTAGWFMENFRNLLVMEDGQSLWVARATPRVWLEQGKKITVNNAPTYFGTLAYEIVSDVDNGKITATVEMPSRRPPKAVLLRFRHPKALPMRSVTVNNNTWADFDRVKEVIRLHGVRGTVKVQATY